MYIIESWNCFDFLIVSGSNIGIILTLLGTGASLGGVISIGRIFRVARVLRLVKRARRLQQLFDTMILGIPSLMNITFVFFLVLFIFSVVGVELFAKRAVNQQLYITSRSNFQTVPNAMLVLFKWATGENIDGAFNQLAGNVGLGVSSEMLGIQGNVKMECVDDPEYDPNVCGFQSPGNIDVSSCIPINGCGVAAAYPFGFLFIFIINYVLLNVFIAVVLEQFGENDTSDDSTLNKKVLDLLVNLWSERDPDATYFMSFQEFSALIYDLPPPLGKKNMKAKDHRRLLLQLDIPLLHNSTTGENMVEFSAVVLALGKYIVKKKAASKGETLEEDIPETLAPLKTVIGDDTKKNAQSAFFVKSPTNPDLKFAKNSFGHSGQVDYLFIF